jgi:hypothetical protein
VDLGLGSDWHRWLRLFCTTAKGLLDERVVSWSRALGASVTGGSPKSCEAMAISNATCPCCAAKSMAACHMELYVKGKSWQKLDP